MELIIQPKDGLMPLVSAIKKATKQIDITIFRFDLKELQRALETAVTRGVKVHALIAHTSGGGQKRLRKLELELLNAGRDGVAHRRRPAALPQQDAARSIARRSTPWDSTSRGSTSRRAAAWAVATKNKAIVAEADKLFEADVDAAALHGESR